MPRTLLKSLFEKIGQWIGLHPDFGRLVSAGFRLTNPAAAALPSENLPLASRVIATGMWNYCFFQFYRHFAGPYWVERQYNPKDPSFIPRAGSFLSVNLTHRNWTGLRSPDYSGFSIVDPAGALSPIAGSCSIELALLENGKLLLPSRGDVKIRQSLHDDQPIPVTEYLTDKTTLRWSCAGMLSQSERLLSLIEYETAAKELELIVAIRPFNPEGGSLIHTLSLDEQNRVLINNAPELFLSARPDRIRFSSLEKGDAYFTKDDANQAVCSFGVCTGALHFNAKKKGVFHFTVRTGEVQGIDSKSQRLLHRLISSTTRGLPPEEREQLQMDVALQSKLGGKKKIRRLVKKFRPSFSRKTPPLTPGAVPISFDPETELKQVSDWWQKKLAIGSAFQTGNPEWNRAAGIFKGHLLTLCANNTITPGVFTYGQFWFRDSAYMISALANWNFLDAAKAILETYPSLQSRDGFFKSHDGEWDSNGQAIWTLAHFYRLTGDTDFLSHVYPAMRKGGEWIVKKRREGYKNRLMPAGFSAEHLGPADYYFWDNFWSIAGLEEIAACAKQLGHNEECDRFERAAAEYTEDLVSISAPSRNRYGLITAGPLRPVDAGMIGNMCLLYPLDMKILPEREIQNTVNAVYHGYFLRGLFFHSIIHSGMNIYLSLHTAQALFRLGKVKRARKILKRVLEIRTDHWSYPEAIHPLTGGGVMGDGFHGWAFAEILHLLRDFTVLERGDTLDLFAGYTEEELFCDRLHIGPFPLHGTTVLISGTMERSNGKLTVSIPRIESTPIRTLRLHFPATAPSTRFRINGAQLRVDDNLLTLSELHPRIELKYTTR